MTEINILQRLFYGRELTVVIHAWWISMKKYFSAISGFQMRLISILHLCLTFPFLCRLIRHSRSGSHLPFISCRFSNISLFSEAQLLDTPLSIHWSTSVESTKRVLDSISMGSFTTFWEELTSSVISLVIITIHHFHASERKQLFHSYLCSSSLILFKPLVSFCSLIFKRHTVVHTSIILYLKLVVSNDHRRFR